MRTLDASSVSILIALVNVAACAREAQPPHYGYVSEPSLPPRPAFDPDAENDAAERRAEGGRDTIMSSGPLAGAPAVRAQIYSVQQSARTARASAHRVLYGNYSMRVTSASASSLPSVADASDPSHAAKIEREAQLTIGVPDVTIVAASIVAMVHDRKGVVAKDERSSGGTPTAELLVRVPVVDFDAFVDAVAKLGEVKMRRVRMLDATLEHKDIEVLVANLEAAQARYRDLLQHATDPAQILAIERELERVRADLERIKARLDYLRDRVAFATVAISLVAPTPETDVTGGYRAHIATGFRGVTLLDVRDGGGNAYTGAGLSLRFPRSTGDSGRGFVLDIDVMHACCKTTPDRSAWAYDVLTGFDLYSESLENGGRRWLNPYLGVRAGVAQTQDRIDFAAAAVIGLEIVKTRVLVIDVQTRVMALVGNPDGPHGALQPSLGFDLGF
jgi:hypothetical protein